MLSENEDSDNNNNDDNRVNEDIPRELQDTLDGNYWSSVGFTMSDTVSDLAVNLDKFYWRNDDPVLEEEVCSVLSAVAQWTSFTPNYLFSGNVPSGATTRSKSE